VSALPGLFVVGTDTGVGKTYVASAIARSLVDEGRRVGVLKPVATGLVDGDGAGRGEDAGRLIAAVGGSIPPEHVVPLAFNEPLAPAVAARRLGRRLDPAEVEQAVDAALAWWRARAEVMVVEGVGGLLTPLAEGMTLADLAVRLDYPLVVVARRGLGTLNHTLLTIEAARHRGLRIAGVVLNGAGPTMEGEGLAEATNADELARRLADGIAVLAEVPFGDGLDTPGSVLRHIDWSRRALLPRLLPSAVPVGVAGETLSRINAQPVSPS
jgi:dethiobiotin synthetase